MPDKAKAIAVYNAWADEVRAAIPANRLLVFKVSEGWGPLCAFLWRRQAGHEIPERQRSSRVQGKHRGHSEGRLCHPGRHRRRRWDGDWRRILAAAVGRLRYH